MSVDLLSDLESLVDETPKSEVVSRPKLELLKGNKELFEELAGIKTIFKLVEERKGILTDQFKDRVWVEFTNHWFENKGRPKNPTLETRENGKLDIEAILQLQSKIKVNVPGGSTPEAVLEGVGFSKRIAQKIVEENVVLEIVTQPRPFNELLKGHFISGKNGREFVEATDVEKSAAAKLLSYLTGKVDICDLQPLTQEERIAILTKKSSYVVKSGFLDRAPTYCKDADQLRELCTVISPQTVVSHIKFGQSDSATERNNRLVDVFKKLIEE